MASLGTIILTGASGTKYVFHIYDKNTTFQKFGAVYAITRKEDNSLTHNIIYIGHTGDTSERFDNHHRIDCFNRNKWNRICIHSDDSEKSRLKKESDLIEKYDPPCNKQ
jgi:hypothetical protein